MEPMKIVHRYFDLFKTGDLDGVMDLLSEDVVWNVAGVPNVSTVGLLRGKENVRKWMEDFPKNFSPLDFCIDKYFENGNDVIVTGRFRHTVLSTNRVAGSDLIVHFTVKNDLVCRYQIFEDSAILSQAFDGDYPWKSYKQRLNGTEYAFDDSNHGAPLLFAHGLFVNRSFFSQQITSLASQHRCMNFNLPGHGESGTPKNSWSLEDVADDLALFIEENHLAPVNFVGHSQGGMVGIRLAAKYPKLINKLILIGASARPEFVERLEEWKLIKEALLSEDDTNLDELFAKIQERVFPSEWLANNPAKASEERKMMMSNSKESMAHSIDSAVLNRTDVTDLLKTIEAEVLVICGDDDQATPPALSEEIATGIPNSHLQILPKIGHHAPFEAPKTVTELINNFLKIKGE